MQKKLNILLITLLVCAGLKSSTWTERVDSLNSLLPITQDDSTKVQLYLDIAYEYFAQDPKESLLAIQSGLEIADELADSTLRHLCYAELSYYYSLMNNFESALEFIHRATDMAGNDKNKLAFCLLNTADVHYFNDDFDKTIYYLKQAYTLSNEIQDTMNLSLVLHDIGTWHLEMENYDSAIFYIHKANSLYTSYADEVNPYIICHLGETYANMGEYDSALYYLFEAMRLDSLLESEYDVAVDESYLSNTFLRKKDYPNTIYYANRSIERAKKLDLLDIILHNYEQLTKAYTETNDYELALKYSNLRNNYADSLRIKNKDLAIQSLEAKYRFDQQQNKLLIKNAENKLLRKQKRLLLILSILCLLLSISTFIIIIQKSQRHRAKQRLLSELEQANAAKERLISIISHDLRSSIGNIKNSAQIFQDDELDQETKNELLNSFFPVIDSTYDLLENLLTWANYNRNDLKPSIKKVQIRTVIDQAINHTNHLSENKLIRISNNLDNVSVLADNNMLSTIARNLISNAVKFSNPNSVVTLSSAVNDNILIVKVEDNGIGIPKDVLENIFQKPSDFHSKGTRGERGSGLGLSICKSFIDNMGGAIWAESEPEKGSSFYFSLPIA